MNTNFVKVFDARKYISELERTSDDHFLINDQQAEILITRFALLESLLEEAMPLLERSRRIIANQVPGIPHSIETDLETLRIEIDEALTKIETKAPQS